MPLVEVRRELERRCRSYAHRLMSPLAESTRDTTTRDPSADNCGVMNSLSGATVSSNLPCLSRNTS